MTVGVGVIGAGMMGADHVRTLTTGVSGARVVAITEADPERADQVAREAGGCRVHADALDLVADPEVDGVVIASPAETHEKFTLACIDAAKPVLCEKPLAPTPEACLRVVDAEVSRGGRLVQLGFMRRFDPAYVALKQAYDSGAVGGALVVHCVHRNPETPPGFTSEMMITDAMIHELDLTRWLLGEDIVAVTVHAPRRSGSVPADLQDPVVAMLRTGSGALVDVEVFANARYGYDIRCEIVGESGTLSLVPPAMVSTRGAGGETQPVPSGFRERFTAAYRSELQAWVDSVASGAATGPSAWDGYASIVTAQAGLESLAAGRTVEVEVAARPDLYR